MRSAACPTPTMTGVCASTLTGLQALQDLPGELSGFRRSPADLHSGRLEGLLLGGRRSRRAGHDGARVAHRLAFRSGESRDIADDRLGHVGLDVVGRTLLGVTADLTDHHDDLGVGILLEALDGVDVGGADDRVPTDADRCGEPEIAQFVHHLVRQRARLGHQPDGTGSGDVGGGDADQRLTRGDDAWTVRSDDAGLAALVQVVRPGICAVLHRNSLGDDHQQRDLGVDGLDDIVLGELRRHKDDRHVGAGLLHGLCDAAEHRQLDDPAALVLVRDRGARLARVHTADDLGARLEHSGGVHGGLAASDALDDDLVVFVQEDSHGVMFLSQALASSAALSAASSIVGTNVTRGWLASARIRRPSSTLLPSRRTTSGLLASAPRISSALTIPVATASHEVMPPNTLTNTLLTCASPRTTSNPAAITCAEAPPPMSRKLAGLTPPCFSPA